MTTDLKITSSALQTGVTGVKRGFDGAARNAATLASKDTLEGNKNPVEPLVDLKINQYQVQASGKVIETVDKMLGILLDEKA